MACQAMRSWTLSGLLAAFLDLAVTYFLLCCSTLAFFLSKPLRFFGLNLPCTSCCLNGFSAANPNPNPSCCRQRALLVDSPATKLSGVQFSTRSKLPVESVFSVGNEVEQHQQLNVKLIGGMNFDRQVVELGGEASASSPPSHPSSRSHSISDVGSVVTELSFDAKDGRFDIKGKSTVVVSQSKRIGLKRRCRRGRKGNLLRHETFTSSSSFSHLPPDSWLVPVSPSSIHSMMSNEITEDNSILAAPSNELQLPSTLMEVRPPPHIFEPTDVIDLNGSMDKHSLSSEDQRSKVKSGLGLEDQQVNVIRVLEQSLKEVQAARANLSAELEKERIAAATAADEAMAMILRLQEEKASLEMEARQYQRILEEKSSYDDQEMGILKDVIVRRELEKHFLEKEVEAYKNLILKQDQLKGEIHANMDGQEFDEKGMASRMIS